MTISNNEDKRAQVLYGIDYFREFSRTVNAICKSGTLHREIFEREDEMLHKLIDLKSEIMVSNVRVFTFKIEPEYSSIVRL